MAWSVCRDGGGPPFTPLPTEQPVLYLLSVAEVHTVTVLQGPGTSNRRNTAFSFHRFISRWQ